MSQKGILSGIVGVLLILLALAGTASALSAIEANATPEIVSVLPGSTAVSNNAGEIRTFIITASQEANVTWSVNGTQVQSNTSVITSMYINDSAATGSWNVTAVASNDKGMNAYKWDWSVKSLPAVHIELMNFAFNPANITIQKGTTVIWTNNDGAQHTVTSDTSGIFDSGSLNQGDTFEWTFNETGAFNYHCIFHPSMQGTVIVMGAPTPVQPPVDEIEIDLELVAENFTAPIALVSPDDGTGRRFIVDQIGLIRILMPDGQILQEPFMDIRSRIVNLRPQYDERGLLGLAFHPNFTQNGRFFIYYSAPLRSGAPANWDHTSNISEFRVLQDDLNKSDPRTEKVLLQVDKPQSNHNAGQIAFGPDGYLYIPVGDGGGANDAGIGHPQPGNAQNTSTMLGKILRIDVDDGTPYGIPQDNPFVGKDGLDEIFAYGFRNPFHIAFDAGGNHSLFVSDAGQNAREEVDIVTKGSNYGWNIKEGTHCFDPNEPNLSPDSCPDSDSSGMPLVDPVIEYANARQPGGIGVVVVGGYVYRGNAMPQFNGAYIFGDFSKGFTEGNGSLLVARSQGQKMWSINELKIATSASGRIGAFVHSFGQDADHEIYVMTSQMLGPVNNTGKVFKIKPVAISQGFTANLSGDEIVPPINTPAKGSATFDINDNGTVLYYRLMVENITNVTMAHIHMAPSGKNGSVVAWLYPNVPPAVLIPGRFDGLLAEGNITSANLTGPLDGKSLDILMEYIMNGNTYVNVHTDQYPAGEIRGQIKPVEAVPSVAPEIKSFIPEKSNVTDIAGGPTRTFTINVNQIVNVSWQVNGKEVSGQTNVNTSSYSNGSAASGIWNITAIASNLKGSDMHTWVWTVKKQIIGNGSISGQKFNDSNGNGIKDQEESGLSNWTIELKNSTGSTVETMMTDIDGNYTFNGLEAGNYTVEEVLQAGWKQTFPPGIYNVTLASGENVIGMDFGNNLMPPLPSGVNATRDIEKESLRLGEFTNITVTISSDIIQGLVLQELIPAGWKLTRISDDVDGFKNSTNEWAWSNVTPGIDKKIVYSIVPPVDATIGTYYINGTISNLSGVIAVGGNNIIILDIYAYYRRLGSDPERVETRDLLKAMDDWRTGTAPVGFVHPITLLELSALTDEWATEVIPTALKITSFTPSKKMVNDDINANRTFKITMNQIANVKWLINGTEVFNESDITTSSYTNTSSASGIWNVTAVASNSRGSEMHTWVWEVSNVSPPADILTSQKVASAPVIDGTPDSIWDQAIPLTVSVSGGANAGRHEVILKSIYTGDSVYFLAKWNDPTESLRRLPWQKQADGTWKQLKTPDAKEGGEDTYYEDKFSQIWDINITEFEASGCSATCHAGENSDIKAYGNMYTSNPGEIGDLWHMKMVRTNTTGFADDQYIDSTRYGNDTPDAGRKSDPGLVPYYNNINVNKTAPNFTSADQPAPPYWIFEDQKQPFNDIYKTSDEIAGIIVRPPTGDRADILGKAVYMDGNWTLEYGRKLITGSQFDVQFSDMKKEYLFSTAVFDNAQTRHSYETGVSKLVFAVPIVMPELNITTFKPSKKMVNNTVNANRTFKITMNQKADVKWSINGTEVSNESDVTASSYTNTSSAAGIWNVTAVASNSRGSDMNTWIWTVTGEQIPDNADKMLKEGKNIFRFDTFGDEAFWGDTLKLHKAIAGTTNGGVGPGVSPKTSLAVGLKVDVDALPQSLIEDLKKGKVDLNDSATTLALLKLDAVVGVKGTFNKSGVFKSIGITCALCHSTVDDSLAPGIGHRLDGWANRDLNVGAIVNLSPDLSPVADLLGTDETTVRTVLNSWGPGKFDAQLFLDGKAFNPEQVTDGVVTGTNVSGATLIPNAYGLAGFNQATWTGAWGSVPYWNAFVANIEMHGKGTFFDPRLDDASKFPIAAANKFGRMKTNPDDDRITSKLPALQFYQLSLGSPEPQPGIDFDENASARGDELFSGKAKCNNCHTEPLWTEPGWNLHKPSEIGIDSFQADRAPDGLYKTMNLGGIFVRENGKFMNPENKGRFYHDGRFKTLLDVVDHYDKLLKLNLSGQEKDDVVEYVKSLSSKSNKINEGRKIFRFDTFGDEAFWGGTLKLHQGVANVSPKTALAVGLKVDMDALPQSLIEDLKKGKVDLNDPATTLALLKLDAVVGVKGTFNKSGVFKSIGITCALCHSTVDDSLVPGIGHRLDGWANRDLNVGAIVNLSPDLSPVADILGTDETTVRTVLNSWGPGKFDAQLFLDGKAFNPEQVTDGVVTGTNVSGATLIPNAYGLAGFDQATWTGAWGSVPYWNAFVANIEMHGKGTFFDPRLDDASKFPIAAANKFGRMKTNPDDDRITSKLPALQFYQLSLGSPEPQPGIDFDENASARGDELFSGKAKCNNCHTEPLWTEPGWNLHKPSEIGIDSFQADRAPDGLYKTMNLGGVFVRENGKFMNPENKGRFYHDGRFKTLLDVVDHYDKLLKLNLSQQEKDDVVEYLKSLSSP